MNSRLSGDLIEIRILEKCAVKKKKEKRKGNDLNTLSAGPEPGC